MLERNTPTLSAEQIARQDQNSMRILRIIASSGPTSLESLITHVLDSEIIADGIKANRVGFAKLFSAGLVTIKEGVQTFDGTDTVRIVDCVVPTQLGSSVLRESVQS